MTQGIPVIGGFQTPMEKECLRLLIRGSQPVVVCPARSIDNMRVPRDWRTSLDEDRLLILSPFPPNRRRPTAELAAQRNDLVADLAAQVFIAHAAPGGKTEAFARKLAESGKPLRRWTARQWEPSGDGGGGYGIGTGGAIERQPYILFRLKCTTEGSPYTRG